MIPFEPDVVSTTEGKSEEGVLPVIPKVFINFTGMDIFINDQKHTVAEQCTLQTLMALQLGAKQKGVAVAINNTVIPKSDWEKQAIQLNDHILIIKASQGG